MIIVERERETSVSAFAFGKETMITEEREKMEGDMSQRETSASVSIFLRTI